MLCPCRRPGGPCRSVSTLSERITKMANASDLDDSTDDDSVGGVQQLVAASDSFSD